MRYSLFLLLISICVTYAARKCPTPEDCEEKCLQYARHKITGCLKCECVPFEGLWEGDIKLTNGTRASIKRALNNKNPKAAVKVVDKWTDYRKKGEWWIPYDLHSSLSLEARLLIPYAIADFEQKTCLRFHPRKKNQNQYIYFFKGGGCWSNLGKVQPKYSPNHISIGAGCEDKGIIIHEIMHAIGFLHEQSRTDRDDHVKIHWANIKPGRESQFQKYDSSIIDSYGSAYDIESVLQYGSYYFAIDRDLPTITDLDDKTFEIQRDYLAKSDIKQVNAMYRCGPERKCRDIKKGKLCKAFVKRGQCKSHPIEAVRECRKSCKRC